MRRDLRSAARKDARPKPTPKAGQCTLPQRISSRHVGLAKTSLALPLRRPTRSRLCAGSEHFVSRALAPLVEQGGTSRLSLALAHLKHARASSQTLFLFLAELDTLSQRRRCISQRHSGEQNSESLVSKKVCGHRQSTANTSCHLQPYRAPCAAKDCQGQGRRLLLSALEH